MADNEYSPKPFIYGSRGIAARYEIDRVPEQYYLQALNAFERAEESLSSRYGTQILNRDPSTTSPPAHNYLFPSPVVSLARLLSLGQSWRYAATADGMLWRRAGTSQGSFQGVYSGLSGLPLQSLVTTCFETSQAYIFLYDANQSIKDAPGFISSPQLTGIDSSPYTANVQPYSPLLTLVDAFLPTNTYTTSNVSGWAFGQIATLSNFSGTTVTDFPQFIQAAFSIPGGVTTAISAGGGNTSQTAVYSGFGSHVINSLATLSFTFSAQTLAAAGPPEGSGSVQISYSTDGGTTFILFYTWSSSVPGSLAPISISQPIFVSNTSQVQIQVVVSSGSASDNTVQTTASISPIALTPSELSIYGEITGGMISLLSQVGGAGSQTSTVFATEPANLSFNPTQYEFNSNLLRTRGGVGPGVLTDYVIATGFGLAVPPAATILGAQVTLNWAGQNSGTGILSNVTLYNGGVAIGSVKTPNTPNSSAYTNATLGSNSDLWGLGAGFTPTIANSTTFGFGTQVTTALSGGSDRSFLNSWAMTVWWTTGGGSGPSTISSTPIASIVSSDFANGQYNSLTITTAVPHSLTGTVFGSVYGSSNDLADGFYDATVTGPTTLTVPYVSVAAISSTGGTLWASTTGPNECVLTNLYTTPYPTQLSAWGFYVPVPLSVSSFPVSAWSGAIAANTTAEIGVTAPFDLDMNHQVNDSDLIVLTLQLGSPNDVSNVRLQFDVNNSGYTSSYYYADIAPAFYQGNVANQLSAYSTTENQILADTLGLLTGQPVGSTTAQLQPSNFSTGSGAWTTIYIPRGNFLPVGNAGESGLDWSNVTGWQVVVQTNTTGGSTIAMNGLYLQWGYGPSSFGGVGYDWRYTYYNANTGTESNGGPEEQFSEQWGYLSSLRAPFYFRQAAQITGLYSTDPQTTHVRMYRRGGIFANNWLLTGQAPNLTAGGQFAFKDVIPDASLKQAQPLALDNDPPVTSSLVQPLQTTLALPTAGPGNTYYSLFAPQTIVVADSAAQFVPNQTVIVGTPSNLEEIQVIVGGTGQFTAILRLKHNAGEQVSSTSIPRQHPTICCLAYNNQSFVVDPLNPSNVFFSKEGQPENFGPQDYIPVAAPDDEVMALINWRGTLFAATLKTWKIIVGGVKPYAQPTGAAHGLVSGTGWTITPHGIPYRAADGWRVFSGADGDYTTLPIEWVFRASPPTLIPKANSLLSASDVFCFYQNQLYGSYITASNNNQRMRLRFDTNYRRFGIDDVAATAMLWEQDTNTLLVGRQVSATGYAVCQDWVGDFDDGGWNQSGTSLEQTPIELVTQTPYRDLGRPHFLKQWNMLEGDYLTQGQSIQTTLYFNTEPPSSLQLDSVNTGITREKVQFKIPPASATNTAEGVEAYSMSVEHRMMVTTAPTLYQENMYAVLLADFRTSWDSYWQKFDGDYLGILPKNLYIDYTATTQLTVQIFADGLLKPYFIDQETLIPQANRSVVRVQLPARKGRLWRVVVTSTQPFQIWSPVRVDNKPLQEGSGYQQTPFKVYE